MASTFELLLMATYAQLALPVNASPVNTVNNGSATSGVSEIRDDILGVYQCNLLVGRRYLAIMNGLTGNLSVAGDIFLCNIRNSGTATTPNASSTLVAQQLWTSPSSGSSGRVGIPLANSFIAPATGINTFAFFAQRASGSGVFTPVSPTNGVRELYVMYLGTV